MSKFIEVKVEKDTYTLINIKNIVFVEPSFLLKETYISLINGINVQVDETYETVKKKIMDAQ